MAQARNRPEMITPETEQAIKDGLAYLARTQGREGSWRSGGPMGYYPTAMTSLAGLALLAGGNTPEEGPYSRQVRKAVDYILSQAGPRGLISNIDEEQRSMYGHGFSMLFLGQAYGMEHDQSKRERIRKVLIKAVELTDRAQSKAGGWLYGPDDGGDEGSVTITQIQGLRAIRNAGIVVPRRVIDRACEYIEKCANPDGGISYSLSSRGSSRPPITAAAVAVMYNAGKYENPVAEKALKFCKDRMLGKGGASAGMWAGHYFYTMLYLGQAMYLSGEENWKAFFGDARDRLVKMQGKDGGWNDSSAGTGDNVGNTYATAIALLTLQLPYKCLPILQR